MKRFNIIIALAIGVLISSCKKDEDFIGPELVIADPATFEYDQTFKSILDTVDFEQSTATFSAKFNQRASWTITITGDSSGAIKTYSGTGESIDENSLSWDGTFDYKTKLKLFQNETVTASLKIIGLEESPSTQVRIANPIKPFVVLNGFNAPEEYANPIFFTSPDVPDIFIISQVNSLDESPEGKGYINLIGEDIAPSGEYFLGNFGTNNGVVYDKKQILADGSQELYLNFFLKGDGINGTSKLEVQFEETFGDIFSTEVSTKHDGWKFVSIPYSNFINQWAADSEGDLRTPGKRESNLVKGVGFICSSNPQRSTLNIAIDYACLTIGKPLLEIE